MSVVQIDFYAPDDPNGASLGQITDEDCEYIEIYEQFRALGLGVFRIDRTKVSEALVAHGNIAKFTIPVIDSDPVFACVLDDAIYRLVNTKSDTIITYGGPGVLSLLRNVTLYHSSTVADQPARGSANRPRKWWWLGELYGAIGVRVIEEGRHAPFPDPADPDSPLKHVSIDWTRTVDSASVAWTQMAGEYERAIGDNGQDVLFDLQDAGDFTLVGNPNLLIQAFQAYGTDRTSATYASGKVRITTDNIMTDLTRTQKGRPADHLLCQDARGDYFTEVSPAYVAGEPAVWDYLPIPETTDDTLLSKIAQRYMADQRRHLNMADVEIAPGDTPLSGLYLPYKHIRPGDILSVHTGTSAHDYNNAATLLTGMKIKVETASDDATDDLKRRSIRTFLEFNRGAVRRSGSPSGGIRVGVPAISCPNLPTTALIADVAVNGDAEDAGGVQWAGGAYTTSHKFAGSRGYFIASTTDGTITYTFAQPFSLGTRYAAEVWVKGGGTVGVVDLRFGVAGGDETVETDATDLGETVGADGENYAKYRVCYSPTANRTGVRISIRLTQSPADYFAVDSLALYAVDPIANGDVTMPVSGGSGSTGTGVGGDGSGGESAEGTVAAPMEHEHAHGLIDGEGPYHNQYVLNTDGGQEIVSVIPVSGAAVAIDLAVANVFAVTMTDDPDFSFTGLTDGVECKWRVHFRQDAIGGRVPSLPAAVVWPDEIPPVWSTDPGQVDVVEFTTIDGGTTIKGDYGGAPSGASLSVREVGGSDIPDVAEIEFGAAVVTNPGPGVARVELAAAPAAIIYVPLAVDDGSGGWHDVFTVDGKHVMIPVEAP